MNLKQASLFEYGVNMLLNQIETETSKKCVWFADQERFIADFYEHDPFKDDGKMISFREQFVNNLVKNDGFGDKARALYNDLPTFMKQLNSFISKLNESEFVDVPILKNVDFIDNDSQPFGFYIFPECIGFSAVSIISPEIVEKN
ncbi:MAG: hypothetical protein DUD32_04520 [Lactobacillus sp.]|nr:MAG: hypothetical protein DUD32_04520 [Lactobacillus sp.]